MKALKKPLSLLMALLMCFGVFAGTGVTAFAAGETMTTYDTGVTAEYGDKLITLSTCEYSRTNGRMVVVAKLLEE